ncbi:MAG: homoserine kinase [Legionellales bacterium]|jgi:homoserine kinase
MTTLLNNLKTVSAFAPATCANVAVGFDLLGFAIENVGDIVTLTRRDDQQIIIEKIESEDELPLDPDKNTASAVVKYFVEDLNLNAGFSISIKKGLALGCGMGGSAASSVAALVAVNAFLEKPLTNSQLIKYALHGEKVAVGTAHSDNVIPCLYGGLTLTQSLNPFRVLELPIPDIYVVIVHPHMRLDTKASRAVLSKEILLIDHIKQSAYLAGFISALYTKNLLLLQESLHDCIIEPKRATLIPGFTQVKQAALDNGALGASISGSGPSVFAFAPNKDQALNIAAAMQAAFAAVDLESDHYVSLISKQGAKVL